MKIKQLLATLLLLTFTIQSANADEGMWLLNMLGKNYKQMKAQGFRLKPEDVYSVSKSSLKDAIVIFGGYCTGEIVSDKGLVFTNHHCGYTAIQQHSSLGNDYLKEGFWAQSYKDEIVTPDLYVSILQEIADVTDQVNSGLSNKMTEPERQEKIHENINKITDNWKNKYTEDYYDIQITPFFEGNAYYLMLYIKYEDVRMVGTPCDAIGKFGGDTDNWMWPRHTCDFSVFRIYTDINGNPSKYQETNIPMKPKHYLPININGYKEGDFAMVMGFPGSTQRYSTSYEIENDILTNDYRAKIRGIRQEVLLADMEASDEIRIKYATKYAHSSNYWKNAIESNKSLKSLNIVGQKQDSEKAFAAWYSQNATLKSEYQNVLSDIDNASQKIRDDEKVFTYVSECFLEGMELIMHAYYIISYLTVSDETERENFLSKINSFYKDYSKETDYKSSLAMSKLYLADIDPEYYPSIFSKQDDIFTDNSVDSVINTLFSSIFVDESGFQKFLDMSIMDKIAVEKTDPAIKAMRSILTVYFQLTEQMEGSQNLLNSARRTYVKGINEMNANSNLYPDANFTERLTYGKVLSYKSPVNDGTMFNYFTTTEGVLQKEKPGDYEFDVPADFHDLLVKKDFGRYADKDGTLHTCFITDNDITGGNSGSPVLDAYGNLIGLAFDGNSEGMCGDWYFDPQYQRCINVDIRYVLFVIEKYGKCKRIIDELTFATAK